MSDEYTIEEIELTEGFSQHIYKWYNENYIVNHPLSRVDFVRSNNQKVRSMLNDLNELNFLLEERRHNDAINLYNWLDEETKEVIPQNIHDHIKSLNRETIVVDDDDFA